MSALNIAICRICSLESKENEPIFVYSKDSEDGQLTSVGNMLENMLGNIIEVLVA